METTRNFRLLAEGILASRNDRDNAFAARSRFWIERFGDRDITDITTEDIEDAFDDLAAKPKENILTTKNGIVRIPSGKPITPGTVNRYITNFGSIIRELRKARKLPRGFVSPLRGVIRMEEGEGRTLTVTVGDVRRLAAACRISRNRKLAALVAMACTTGWRRGTLQGLTWGQLNLKEGFADTQRTKNGTPHRTPLLSWVADELRRIKPERAEAGDLVFGNGCQGGFS